MKEYGPKKAPRHFGLHPKWRSIFKKMDADIGFWKRQYLENDVPLANFSCPDHTSVTLIPRDRMMRVVDAYGDVVGLEQMALPFSSHDFYFDLEDGWVFQEFTHPAFWRLGDITQLGYLVPPYPEKYPDMSISFCMPIFPHTRWIHCLMAAGLAEVILARNGWSPEERASIVLAVGYHDVAMPAGGDSIKRVDPQALDEETNFLYVLKKYDLVKKWQEQFGFDGMQAQSWIFNKGTIGFLMDIVDKLSYVCLDCYHLGRLIEGPLRQHCLDHPLFGDLWQDVRFSPDRQVCSFTDPERLYQFLLARAYEHYQLLLNPFARIMDFFLENLVRPLYLKNIITKDQLLSWSTDQLQRELARHYPDKDVSPAIITPDPYKWKKFDTIGKANRFCEQLGVAVYKIESLKGFTTGLDWPVFTDSGRTKHQALKKLLTAEQIAKLEDVISSIKGHYVYWSD